MKRTPADRTRACRLRKRRSAGESLPDADTAWLREYESETAVKYNAAPQTVSRETEATPQVFVADDDFKPLSFDEPEKIQTQDELPHAACDIKDCPRCRAVDNAPVCATTGLKVYPRMTDDAAAALAGVGLAVVTIVARIFGRAYKANESDVKRLGRALAEVIYRRSGWTGSVDDILALGFVVMGIGTAVMRAPKIVVDTTASENDPNAPG
jgi:hypothetical protein